MSGPALGKQRLVAAEIARLPAGACVLSVGEGGGRHVVDLALTFPQMRFVACDLDAARVRAADELRRTAGAANLAFFVGDASRLPLRDRSIAFAYVRSVLQFLARPLEHQCEIARVTAGAVLYRDIGNWPFYPLLRSLQALTLRLRGKPDWAPVLRDARLSARASTIRHHAGWYARWFRASGLFREVRIVGHDLLWWDVDRDVPFLGLAGARFGIRCVVGGPEAR